MKKFRTTSMAATTLMATAVTLGAMSAHADLGQNLIVNGSGELPGMTGWTVTNNGGNGWRNTGNIFNTSFEWDTRCQTIDLTQHYSEAFLDSQPKILVGESFIRIGYSEDQYFLSVVLKDADGNNQAEFKVGSQESPMLTSPAPYGGGNGDFFESHFKLFNGYGAGVRSIEFCDGGKDSEWWSGYYGTAMTGAEVRIMKTNR